MEKSWKITLSDGTKLENLGMNGNNFISETEVTEETFNGKLSRVIVEGKEDGQDVKQEYEHMALIHIVQEDDGYHFALRELSAEELKNIKMQGDIEYLAMMSDIDLEEV